MNYFIATLVVATRDLSLVGFVLDHIDVAAAVRCSSLDAFEEVHRLGCCTCASCMLDSAIT